MTLILARWLGVSNNADDILNSGKRDKTEIIGAIVAMTQMPATMTKIRSQVRISHKMLDKYMKLMLALRLIESHKVAGKASEAAQVFQATEKGLAFLKTYCNLLRIIYGEDFLQNNHNLAIVCLKYCKETE